jgi:aldehyde:ferredoxin oxidoreductase
LTWGNVEAVRTLLEKISRREGVGNLLAEGVMRASRKTGRGTEALGVYVLKGATPRGHDHRATWDEMLDTCVSATGTIQALARILPHPFFGIPPVTNRFSPWEIAGAHAKLDGWYVFIDSLGACRFTMMDSDLTIDTVNAATGRSLSLADVLAIGRRTINTLRVFNFRHGLNPDLEAPSPRYGSTPCDGPVEGKSIAPYFQWMKSFYFELMGWDPQTGMPLPHTLKSLGLEPLINDLL